jgi:hypothetical protein
MEITTIGLDLAKNVYQVHAINRAGEVVVRKTIRRAQVLRFFERLDPCVVAVLRYGLGSRTESRRALRATCPIYRRWRQR